MPNEFVKYSNKMSECLSSKEESDCDDLLQLDNFDLLKSPNRLISPTHSSSSQKPKLNNPGSAIRGKKGKKSGKSMLNCKNIENMLHDSIVAGSYVSLDLNDPNFDSESCDSKSFHEWEFKSVIEKSSLPTRCIEMDYFLQKTLGAYEEFLASMCFERVYYIVDTVREMDCPLYNDCFIEMCCRRSLDKGRFQQKATYMMISTLISQSVVYPAQVERAMEKLVSACPDLTLDNPYATDIILRYVGNCVASGILHASFVSRLPENIILHACSRSVTEFPDLVHFLSPLKLFKARVTSLLDLYLRKDCKAGKETVADGLTGIIEKFQIEICRERPGSIERDFMPPTHEFVKKSLCMSMERGKIACEKICDLLVYLNSTEGGYLLHEQDIQYGYWRMIQQLDELVIDIPKIMSLASRFVLKGIVDELLFPSFVLTCHRLRMGGATGMALMEVVSRVVDSPQATSSKLLDLFRENYVSVYDERRNSTVRMNRWQALTRGLIDACPKERNFKAFLQATIRSYFSLGLSEPSKIVRELRCWGVCPDSEQAKEAVRKIIAFVMEMCGSSQNFYENGISKISEIIEFLREESVICDSDIAMGLSHIEECLYDFSLDLPAAGQMCVDLRTRWADDGFVRQLISPMSSNRSSLLELSQLDAANNNSSLRRYSEPYFQKNPKILSCSTITSNASFNLRASRVSFFGS